MSTTNETDLEAMADEELVDAVRQGSQDAYAVLWNRHSGAGRGAARRVTSSYDPDDLVQESFLRNLHAIRSGNGPTGPFRPYLYQTVRSVAITWSHSPDPIIVDQVPEVVDPVDMADVVVEGSVTVTAFKALPERWQAVLWYTQVEGMDAREVAPLLGLSAGSVSALTYRAKEGLRRSWLQAHVNAAAVPVECRWAAEQMGDYNRGALSARHEDRFEEHLTGCLSCSILVEEVDQVASRLGLLLVPLVLGVPAVLGNGSAALGGAGSVAAVGTFVGPTTALASGMALAPGAGSGAAAVGVGGLAATGFSSGAILALVTAAVTVSASAVAATQPWSASDLVVAEQLGQGWSGVVSQVAAAAGPGLVAEVDGAGPAALPSEVVPGEGDGAADREEAGDRSAVRASQGQAQPPGPERPATPHQPVASLAVVRPVVLRPLTTSPVVPVHPTLPLDPPVASDRGAPLLDPTPKARGERRRRAAGRRRGPRS
ncbi:sigma-70 family RNA polymerase sigma factor [Oerskovia sp. Sa1BUA8]|uniref:Sigma-70 family RNA polymerase sigma factor n=1 Tax=Oerskovia douganii TaxID=2762210 RepID=A0A9D5U9H7_9CELL|nr:sigma-70 family RNA polymerase sigma factor [Oerskovia douganii]MBE7698781.1 sigma-70 family RNA polymerase sigma factor [Oerskovia douganii]